MGGEGGTLPQIVAAAAVAVPEVVVPWRLGERSQMASGKTTEAKRTYMYMYKGHAHISRTLLCYMYIVPVFKGDKNPVAI